MLAVLALATVVLAVLALATVVLAVLALATVSPSIETCKCHRHLSKYRWQLGTLDQIHWAFDVQSGLFHHMQINLSGRNVLVTKQFLHSANVSSVL